MPNSFLSDPPLDQVVSKTWEGGFRGTTNDIDWVVSLFHSTNHDDILFIPVEEGVAGNLNNGYFDNVGRTKRKGLEVGLNGLAHEEKMNWFANYSYVDATFESSFDVYNENNPAGENTTVTSGDNMPGIPEHNVKMGADYALTQAFSLGFDATYRSSQYYRGDEANNNAKLSGYTLVNIRGRYNLTKNIEFFAKVDNVFDTEYEPLVYMVSQMKRQV